MRTKSTYKYTADRRPGQRHNPAPNFIQMIQLMKIQNVAILFIEK